MRGLSLSGGGIKAAAHIGALKAFEEEKIKFIIKRIKKWSGKISNYRRLENT